MKKNEVEIGALYTVRVSGQIAPVRIDSEYMGKGWIGTNVLTNRRVRIKTAMKLRQRIYVFRCEVCGEEKHSGIKKTICNKCQKEQEGIMK